MTAHPSSSWRDTRTRRDIEAFVASVTSGPDAVPVEERIAVFDNDGTLWSEKPMITQLHFVVEQWRAAAERAPELAERQPYLAAVSGDFAWLGAAIDKHYGGDDSDLGIIIQALVGLTDGMSVEDYAASVAEFYRTAQHPTLQRPYAETVYQPMVELLRFLEHHGFTCYIVSGGERDFMRPMTQANYGIPRSAWWGRPSVSRGTMQRRPCGTRPPWPSSTMVPRSRSASGPASAGAPCSWGATPTATRR